MKKPFVVIDSDKIRVTDLGNGTSEIWTKTDDTKTIHSNAHIYQELLVMKAEKRPLREITSYRHGN